MHRIEFELARGVLHQFQLNDPYEVLDSVGALWHYATGWLSHRVPTADKTRSRWPVSRHWQDICHAGLADSSEGLERTYKGKQRGELAKMIPALVGYLARFGALTDSYSEEEMFENLQRVVPRFCEEVHTPMNYRIRQKRRELGML